MFKVEFRASESFVLGGKHLTTEWQALDQKASVSEAEIAAAWLIYEIKEFAAASKRFRSVEYRILSDSGEIVATNKV